MDGLHPDMVLFCITQLRIMVADGKARILPAQSCAHLVRNILKLNCSL